MKLKIVVGLEYFKIVTGKDKAAAPARNWVSCTRTTLRSNNTPYLRIYLNNIAALVVEYEDLPRREARVVVVV